MHGLHLLIVTQHTQQAQRLTLTGTEFSLTGGHYNDSAVDTHLNVSGATANQMLKWTGTDYAWVTSTDSDTTYTAGTAININRHRVLIDFRSF